MRATLLEDSRVAPVLLPRRLPHLSRTISSFPCSLPIDLSSAIVTLRPHAATDAGVDPAKCFTVGTLRRTLLFQCDDAGESAHNRLPVWCGGTSFSRVAVDGSCLASRLCCAPLATYSDAPPRTTRASQLRLPHGFARFITKRTPRSRQGWATCEWSRRRRRRGRQGKP